MKYDQHYHGSPDAITDRNQSKSSLRGLLMTLGLLVLALLLVPPITGTLQDSPRNNEQFFGGADPSNQNLVTSLSEITQAEPNKLNGRLVSLSNLQVSSAPEGRTFYVTQAGQHRTLVTLSQIMDTPENKSQLTESQVISINGYILQTDGQYNIMADQILTK